MAELPFDDELTIKLRAPGAGQGGNYGLSVHDGRGMNLLMMSGSVRNVLSSLAEFIAELRDQETKTRERD